MVLNNTFKNDDISEKVLVVCFYLFSIFISAIATILESTSMKAGVVGAMLVFLSLSPLYRLKYSVKIKSAVITLSLFSVIILLYLCSLLIFSGLDNVRFYQSIILMMCMIFVSSMFVSSLTSIKDETFHQAIVIGYWFLVVIGLLASYLIRINFTEGKGVVIFTEPSHFAIVFTPFLMFMVYTASSYTVRIVYLAMTLTLALALENLTLLVGLISIVIIIYYRRIFILSLILCAIISLVISVDNGYFAGRLNFSFESDNLSTLVFLSGWERAYLALIESNGIGLGFQQLGIIGAKGELQLVIQNIMENDIGLNQFDGGSLASKLIAELGVFGLILLGAYLFYASKIALNFSKKRVTGSKEIFFLGIYLMFSIELFVRGMGYFSLTTFMFMSSICWMNLVTRRELK